MTLVTIICREPTEHLGRRYVAGQVLTVSESEAAGLTAGGAFRVFRRGGPARSDRMIHRDGIRTPEGRPT